MSSLIPMVCFMVVPEGATDEEGFAPLFSAIRCVETGGSAQARVAVGDNGRSIGPYQISRAYWADSGIGGHWRQCEERRFAEAVMMAYWKRYCPGAVRMRDFETLARIHNGGPRGHRKAATLPYWSRIRDHVTRSPPAATNGRRTAMR